MFVVANAPAFGVAGYRREPDRFPGAAALGGIYTAIAAARHERVLVVGCDMPFLSLELLSRLMELEGDAVVPRIDGYPEPLHAVYSRACLGAIERRISAGQLKAIGFHADVRVTYVDGVDPRSFRNVNTREALLDVLAAPGRAGGASGDFLAWQPRRESNPRRHP